jgi:hypothetical protein
MKKTANIAGVPVTIVSDQEANEMDYLVCMPDGPSQFTDNFKGVCSHCGVTVMYRWHAPRKPKRICIDCALKLPKDDGDVSGIKQDR